jgi:NTE family protein
MISMGTPDIPEKQRAVIFQGGGALGAYNAGVFRILVEDLKKIDGKNGRADQPLFDILAGTSSGAINAAILVSDFMKNKSWDAAAEQLIKFWRDGAIDTTQEAEFWIKYWEEWYRPGQSGSTAASKEAARRYYSAKHFLQEGAKGVFSRPDLISDDRFYDNGTVPNNVWIQYNNDHLRKRLDDFGFQIVTAYPEPRLLLVSTRVKDGASVTFDSYFHKTEDIGRAPNKRTIDYSQGIQTAHVIASSAVPLFTSSKR